MNKKATYAADTAPFYAVFAIVVSTLFIVFVLLVSSYSTDKVQVPKGLNTYLLTQRFLRSPDCFTYEDISGRSYPLTFDINKFTQANLNNCYVGDEKTQAFRLKLTFADKESILQTNNWEDSSGFIREIPKDIFVYSDNN